MGFDFIVPSNTSSESVFDPKTLKPTLNETDGYYQIGPEAKCSEQFVLSVTVAFATNLPQVRIIQLILTYTVKYYTFTVHNSRVLLTISRIAIHVG